MMAALTGTEKQIAWTMSHLTTKRYTACFHEGERGPYMDDAHPLFDSLELIRAELSGITGIERHQVDIGTVELDEDGDWSWSSWELVETVWVGDEEG
jgi:hypothetical protein